MSVLVTNRGNRVPANANDRPAARSPQAASGKLVRLPLAPTAPEQHVLAVEFRSPEGRRWHAIGGGTTLADAIIYARESCPDGVTWDAVRWSDLYGE
ncbi:MAG: hypothetical protein ACXVRK_15780 [Gaiellaceae bacterium]